MNKKMGLRAVTAEMKKLLEQGNMVIGTDRTLKGLENNDIARVFVTEKVPSDTMEKIQKSADLSGAEVIEIGVPNEELGVLCKKPYSISVLSVNKE